LTQPSRAYAALVTGYLEIPQLQHFVLEESFVLDISERPDSVELGIDLVFARDHPDLLSPRPGEWAYLRTGVIRFTGVSTFRWSKRTAPVREPDGSSSWNGIDSFIVDAQEYLLSGSFGVLHIVAEGVEVELTGPV